MNSTQQQPLNNSAASEMDLSNHPETGFRYYRWIICALLFFATTINYLDRAVLGILAPTLQKSIGWNEQEYGLINTAFTAAYAVGLLAAGGLIDRFGTRKMFSFFMVAWSLAGMAHAGARNFYHFGMARFALGLGESGNFPGSIKTIAEWFPKKERALATGIFNGGSNVGAILAPLVVVFLTDRFGWQSAFIATGAAGFIWLIFWLWLYRRPEDHPRVTRGEVIHIRSDAIEKTTKIPWVKVFPHRQTLAFVMGKFLTDPVWWFYLFWLGKFLDTNFHLKLNQLPLPVIVVYLTADVGSIAGGWLSSHLISKGWSANRARKTTMLLCALCVVPVMIAPHTGSSRAGMWLAVTVIGLAAGAHQGWSANIFTLVSDMFPRRAVASVTGIGGMAGAVGGIVITALVGYILEHNGSNYTPIFVGLGCMYLIAITIIHLLVPRLEPANLEE